MKKINIWVILGLLSVLLLGGFASRRLSAQVTKQSLNYNSKMCPIILVPGSSATQNRFDGLVDDLNQASSRPKAHSLLKITVSESGRLDYSGQLDSKDEQPYIVVAFANNSDGYSNIKRQARWFNIAMKDLENRYHFNRYRGIGHSNGGLVWSLYLEQFYTGELDRIERLMTIGTPYNLEETTVLHPTQLLTDLKKNRLKLPDYLTVYSIAGSETFLGDGIVPLSSVEAGKYIFQNVVKHYTLMTVSGDDAAHSDLVRNPETEKLIMDNILVEPEVPGGHLKPLED